MPWKDGNWRISTFCSSRMSEISFAPPATISGSSSVSFFSPPETEGEKKPLKYPTIFNTADVALITKMDLAAAAEFDLKATRKNIQSVRPGMRVLEVSSKTGQGMEEVITLIDNCADNHPAERLSIDGLV